MVANIQLRSTQQFSIDNGVKMVVYGRAGAGKTRLCATCPSPVIFSAESGLMSLREYNLPYYPIASIADVREVYNWARSSVEARQFQTICVDSISDVAETVLGAYNQKGANGKKPDGREAYGLYNDDLLKILKDFRDLPGKHVYMSAKQEKVKSGEGLVLNGPMLPGAKMNTQLPYVPDLLLQLDIDPVGGWRFLRTQADYANDAKDRSGCLDAAEPPDLGHIIDKIQGRLQRPG
jgi:hypothetical protein